MIPDSEIRQVCEAITNADLSSSGYDWVYDPIDSASGRSEKYESTRGVLCSYTTADRIENLAIWIFLEPYPSSTIKSDINLGLNGLVPIPGVGAEAYAHATDSAATAYHLLARDDSTWFYISIWKNQQGINAPDGTLAQYSAVANTVLKTHPRL